MVEKNPDIRLFLNMFLDGYARKTQIWGKNKAENRECGPNTPCSVSALTLSDCLLTDKVA